jgi:Na(+)-translocating NADH:ubiquinone oxidoreductase C subunit
VLESLPVDLPTRASPLEVHRIFLDKVSPPEDSYGNAYVLKENGQVVAYAVPLEGKGFWDKIKGFIGVAADMRTVTGISFYEQNETPGLGAEIAQPPFRSQFVGKRMADGHRPIGILPVGSSVAESDVHAVTGATQTSTRLETIISTDLNRWRSSVQSLGDAGS